MKPRIKDLAKELNLSVATISKALKDSHEISPETKKRVLDLARQLNYAPNPYASSLRKKSSKTIAVVLPEVADSFFSVAINGIEEVARENGYHVLIYLTHESFAREEAILREFRTGRVDGILMSVSGETSQSDHVKAALEEGIPVMFFDRVCEDVETAHIITDDFESGFNATRHLIEKGCKKIAYLAIAANLSVINSRMKGYQKALADSGSRDQVIHCSNDIEKNYGIIFELLNSKDRPDGIVASVEKLTTSIYLACSALHLDIPADVKVVSFTNLQTAVILNPSLTTITQPAFEMGRTAATVLFKALGKRNLLLKKEMIVIPSTLHPRASTD